MENIAINRLTPFGKWARVFRLKRGMILGKMSEALGVGAAYLCAVEFGKKLIPPEWEEQLASIYHLTSEERQKLHQAIKKSK